MVKAYLLFNAFVYLALAIWCTIRHGETSRGTGYLQLSPGGHSEYLAIYGGLQLGLAAAFAWAAFSPAATRHALIFSVLLYAPIVIYRLATVLSYRVRAPITLGTGALEVVLLIGAIVALYRMR